MQRLNDLRRAIKASNRGGDLKDLSCQKTGRRGRRERERAGWVKRQSSHESNQIDNQRSKGAILTLPSSWKNHWLEQDLSCYLFDVADRFDWIKLDVWQAFFLFFESTRTVIGSAHVKYGVLRVNFSLPCIYVLWCLTSRLKKHNLSFCLLTIQTPCWLQQQLWQLFYNYLMRPLSSVLES